MTAPQIEIQVIAALVAVSCALPGTFLVLRGMAMMSDAISHSILLGIVLAFFATGDLTSPFLVAAAALTGVLTVTLVELLNRTGLVREDAAIGLTFPALFSAGVILVSRYAGSIHLDTDAVLLGELAFAPFNRLVVLGYDIGPRALHMMAGITVLNIMFVAVFFKELKLSAFDPGLAAVLGFSPGVLHYASMGLVSLTAVGSFDAVGSILVVALMIAPPATAYLLADRLSLMLLLSALLGAAGAVSGYWVAHVLDASIAGSMASMSGLLFAAAYLAAPRRGLIPIILRRSRQRLEFAQRMLLVHLYNHEGLPDAGRKNRAEHLQEHMRWDRGFAERVVEAAGDRRLVERRDSLVLLTDAGRKAARDAMVG